jgi:hypothetical protein
MSFVHRFQRVFTNNPPFLQDFHKNNTFFSSGNYASISPVGPIRTGLGNIDIFIKYIRRSSGMGELWFRMAGQPSIF